MRPPAEFGLAVADGGVTNPAAENRDKFDGVIRETRDFTRRPFDETLQAFEVKF